MSEEAELGMELVFLDPVALSRSVSRLGCSIRGQPCFSHRGSCHAPVSCCDWGSLTS